MCRLTTCASARTPVSTSLATERAPRRRHSRRRGSAPPRARDDIDAAVDAVDEDDYTKWQRSPQSAAWERMASKDPSGSSYRVGAKPLDEKFLSELMLALLRNHAKGLKADVLLKKVQSNMELDGYKSVLVGIGRMERWELAREVIDFVKAGGRERGDEVLTSNWFMALATRRLEEKAYDACCDVFQYMKEFGSVPSGETIEVFAKLTDAEPFMTESQKRRVREVSTWLGMSDAGQALWRVHFGDPFTPFQPGAPGTVQPNRTVSVAVESENIDIFGDIDKLREQLKDFY